MVTSPYYKILIEKNEKDLTPFVTMLSHEDAVDVDSLITLKMVDGVPDYLEDLELVNGDTIILQYGYIKGKSSPKYSSRIVDLVTQYGQTVTTKLLASDLGILIKKNQSKKIWQGITSTDIAIQIAEANGLVAIVAVTSIIHEFVPQAGRTDYEFLKYLATLETDGSYRFFLRGDELHFTKRNLDKESLRTFTYGDPDGEVISFKPANRETTKDGASRNTVVTSVDPLTNEVINESVSNTNSLDDTKLDEFPIHFNENGELVAIVKSAAKALLEDPNRAGKQLNIPVIDIDAAKNLGNKTKKDTSLDDVTAKLTIVGDPFYLADEIITMAGVAKKDSGNWYIKRANHTINGGGGYITTFALQKNGIKKSESSDGTSQTPLNETVGVDAGEPKKAVDATLYDANGITVETKKRI